ncbi:MAG: Rieske (2Fe-2S) protein [Alphaproteobacteria bacterium]|nr:Rieske (2Fe-2S) protein [Alphaproteobacteria bacterium]
MKNLPADSITGASPTAVDFRYYRDPEIFEAEQRHIYAGPTWSYLGLEAELPNPGDFIASIIGAVPVVLTRGPQGALHGWVNRCAHKGAMVCRRQRGNAKDGSFVCVYHQWAYDAEGNLAGAPFQRGVRGQGGYAADFDRAEHGLQKVRVASLSGMVFGTLSDSAPPLESFLGEVMCANVRRVLNRPIRILGYARQMMAGNWKLYSENSRDSYHGGLLHLFYPTFGIYRPSQDSQGEIDTNGFHSLFSVFKSSTAIDYKNFSSEANREMKGAATLQDARVIQYKPDIADNVALSIQSLFPSVVLQQIQNTLAARQVIARAVDQTELIWTYFGYADDDAEMTRHRIRNLNLVGPAGYISMEDGEAVELCQNGTAGSDGARSYVAMGNEGGILLHVAPLGMDENNVRGFWKGYFELMRGWDQVNARP